MVKWLLCVVVAIMDCCWFGGNPAYWGISGKVFHSEDNQFLLVIVFTPYYKLLISLVCGGGAYAPVMSKPQSMLVGMWCNGK